MAADLSDALDPPREAEANADPDVECLVVPMPTILLFQKSISH